MMLTKVSKIFKKNSTKITIEGEIKSKEELFLASANIGRYEPSGKTFELKVARIIVLVRGKSWKHCTITPLRPRCYGTREFRPSECECIQNQVQKMRKLITNLSKHFLSNCTMINFNFDMINDSEKIKTI